MNFRLLTSPSIIDPVKGLVGANGVEVIVDGVSRLYDVKFMDGTCIELFTGCDNAADFAFTTLAQANAASQALLDHVFIDVPGGPSYDSLPTLTHGCERPEPITRCLVMTPYEGIPFTRRTPIVNAVYAANVNSEPADKIIPIARTTVWDTKFSDDEAWAVWTLSSQSPTNATPVADFNINQLTNIGTQPLVSLDASVSSDLNDPITSLNFDWSVDGTPVCLGNLSICETPMNFGLHAITLRVTDPQGAYHEKTTTMTFDPASLSLVDMTKARIDFKDIPNTLEVLGDVTLPFSVNSGVLSPEATVSLDLAGIGVLDTPLTAVFGVSGANNEIWTYIDPLAAGLTELTIDWGGLRFNFSEPNYPFQFDSPLITTSETVLIVTYDVAAAGGPFDLTINGRIFHVDAAGLVTSTALDVIIFVDEPGSEVTLTLPFPISGQTIAVSGNVNVNKIIPVDPTTSTGRFRIRGNFNAADFPLGAATSPKKIDLMMTVGQQRYPGATSIGGTFDSLQFELKGDEWRLRR